MQVDVPSDSSYLHYSHTSCGCEWGCRSSKSAAKVGRIHTPHGVIDTPGFVAVGTNAALKAVDIPWADAGAASFNRGEGKRRGGEGAEEQFHLREW